MRFYEINPAVQPIAQHLFTYLRDSPAQISFADGDARASLAKEAPQHFDVLVIDAFSGDAIPLHLLTTQALAIYRASRARRHSRLPHLKPACRSRAGDLPAGPGRGHAGAHRAQPGKRSERGEFNATWVLVTDNDAFLTLPAIAGHSQTDGTACRPASSGRTTTPACWRCCVERERALPKQRPLVHANLTTDVRAAAPAEP